MTNECNTSYFLRVASFKPVSHEDFTVSYLLLASHGYYYTGHDLEIECQGCGTKVNICQDNSNIQDKLKHKGRCHFDGSHWWTGEELTGLNAQAVAASNRRKLIEFDREFIKPSYVTPYSQNYLKRTTLFSDDVNAYSNKPTCLETYSHDEIKGTTFSSDDFTASSNKPDSHYDIKGTTFSLDDVTASSYKLPCAVNNSHEDIKGITFSSEDVTTSSNKPVCLVKDSHDEFKGTTLPSEDSSRLGTNLPPEDSSEAYKNDDNDILPFLSENYTGSEAQRESMLSRSLSSSSSSSKSSGYHSDTSNESAEASPSECTTFINASLVDYYDFPELFSPEGLWFNSSKKVNDLDLNGQDCDKNPGHFSYFPWISLKLEQIPSAFRVLEMFDLLKLMGELTVRITVSTTSKLRPSEGLTRINGCKARIGTGFAIKHACHVKKTHGSEQSKYKHIKRWLKLGRKKDIGYVYIQTSRHLVFNDEEAQNAVVDFFYDTPDAKDVITLQGKFLMVSSTAGDNQCLLVCECPDLGFIHKINQLQRELVGVAHRLPLKAKKRMSKKMFMIHHPHGGPKVLSYGDYVRLKYRFNIKGKCRATLTKLTANEQGKRSVYC
uniref:Uncharacterized protein n=1 Tax=Biomphalaria glabrata TaxID=6526 RepID=A0A2C9KTY7_BIOGL